MKKIIYGIFFLINASIFAMQKPVRVYDSKKTYELKVLLNNYNVQQRMPVNIVKQLVIAGADPNVKADSGSYEARTWMSPISTNLNQEALQIMLEHGAIPVEGQLTIACSDNIFFLARLLLDCGANVHEAPAAGFTPLHHAVHNISLELVELLLSRGAKSDINKPNLYHETPFSIANKKRHQEIIELFIKYLNEP